MKSLMLKLLMIAVSANVLAAEVNKTDEKVLDFLKESVSVSQKYDLKGIRIVESQDIPSMPGWSVYFLKLRFSVIGSGARINLNERIFTNGDVLSRDFINMENKRSIKNNLYPTFKERYYKDENLVAGTKDAPNRLAVFSDPLCPFCMDYVPELLAFVQKHKEDFSLYYYNFPLNIHPNSPTLIKASFLAKKDGQKDVLRRMYEEVFDFEKDVKEKDVLASFNAAMGTDYTLEQINQPEIIEMMENDIEVANRLMVNSTPLVFLNGKVDITKKKHLSLVK